MERFSTNIPRILYVGIYAYLILPIIIFFSFWLKRPIGIPAAFIVLLGFILCYRAHDFNSLGFIPLSNVNKIKCLAILAIIILWVILSGIGRYVWQNEDHYTRNETFNVIVQNSWPVYSNTSERVPLVYYIGFWLPAGVVGKLFGLEAGYFFQTLWAVIGILLCYSLICLKRKKVSIWPLIIFIFFSGLDYVGTILINWGETEILGSAHIENWSWYYQFSSMTTQLFWVFNQAIPAWLACTLIFLYEKPKNMLFTLSTLLLVSSFPFAGLIPFVIYFMIKRSTWKGQYAHAHNVVADIWRNWASIQNILISIIICGIIGLYLSGNKAVSSTVSILYSEDGAFKIEVVLIGIVILAVCFFAVTELSLHKCGKVFKIIGLSLPIICFLYELPTFTILEWWSTPFVWVNLTVFFFLEAGFFLLVLYPFVQDKRLFWLNAIWLYLIPLIRVGTSIDFCMRASIPGLLLILLWCIEVFDNFKFSTAVFKQKTLAGMLVVLLIIGSITPIHEFKRTYICSFYYYELTTISEAQMYSVPNVCGNPDSFFWKYLARR